VPVWSVLTLEPQLAVHTVWDLPAGNLLHLKFTVAVNTVVLLGSAAAVIRTVIRTQRENDEREAAPSVQQALRRSPRKHAKKYS
jgi:hypothetical protein